MGQYGKRVIFHHNNKYKNIKEIATTCVRTTQSLWILNRVKYTAKDTLKMGLKK